jgi:DNA transformation protein and related proteins
VSLSRGYLDYVLGQLAALGAVSARRMFGGAGLYAGERFFGLVSGDVLYLRVSDASRADYRARGMAAFRPFADRPHLSEHYFEVPAEVLEDADQLCVWAGRALQAAQAAPARQRRRRAPRPRRP